MSWYELNHCGITVLKWLSFCWTAQTN